MSSNCESRFLFTEDGRLKGEDGRKGGEKDLYTRANMSSNQFNQIKPHLKEEDPILLNLTGNYDKTNSDIISEETSSFYLNIDILVGENDDFVQYHGTIDNNVINDVRKSNIASGLDNHTLRMWICGLLLTGEYDDGEHYSFTLNNLENSLSWNIKILHAGLFKSFLKIPLCSQSSVDIDEYFLDDLKDAYRERIKSRKIEKEASIREMRLKNTIEKCRNKKESTALRESVQGMKERILKYFIPAINGLLSENNRLLEELGRRGDVLESLKKLNSNKTGNVMVNTEEVIKKKGTPDENADDDFDEEIGTVKLDKFDLLRQKEMKARWKYDEERKKNDISETKETSSFVKVEDNHSDEDLKFLNEATAAAAAAANNEKTTASFDVMFVGRKRHLEEGEDEKKDIQYENDDDEKFPMRKLLAGSSYVSGDGMLLNEDTQLEEETDISENEGSGDKSALKESENNQDKTSDIRKSIYLKIETDMDTDIDMSMDTDIDTDLQNETDQETEIDFRQHE